MGNQYVLDISCLPVSLKMFNFTMGFLFAICNWLGFLNFIYKLLGKMLKFT